MITITGKYNTALCYCRELEANAAGQIQAVCDTAAFAGSRIRIMPDVHAGMGCTIGTTMTITDKVVPGMVGVDIGCGMETVRLHERELDLARLDALVRARIPYGREVRENAHRLSAEIDLKELRCFAAIHEVRARRSIGTLGGGNHFIELDRDDEGALYLVVHSGSRHLGKEVALFYQGEGARALAGCSREQLDQLIAALKAAGRTKEIHTRLQELKSQRLKAPDLAYVEGALLADYLHDMKLIQRFAALNRQAIVETILHGLGLHPESAFTTVHNYIDTERMILRKGAVSARAGEPLLIPLNMRDGSLICRGLGNPEWNWSAPHGAGRLMSRRQAAASLTMEQFQEAMAGIYSSSVSRETLDEAPMAYKPMAEITSQIGATAEIVRLIRPLYNFKAAD